MRQQLAGWPLLVPLALMVACDDGSTSADGGRDIGIRQDSFKSDSDRDGASPDLPPGHKRVFVSSTKHDGNLGGLTGADAKCQQTADAAGLGGRWIAWVSTTTADAIDRLADVGPWYGLDGKRFFADKAAVASITTGPDNGLWRDEKGSFLPSDRIWTGTGPGGRYVSSIGDACQAWTSASMSDQARIGIVGRVDYTWTSYSFTTCDQAYLRPICFEQ